MNKIIKALLSMQAMAAAMLVFAFAVGYATFIENDFGTPTAKALIYNARWFEVLLIFLGINLIANMRRFKMFKEPFAMRTVFHVSFLIILAGAGLTRYVGYEGVLHIREGETENRMLSAEPYFSVDLIEDKRAVHYEESMLFSKLSDNYFKKRYEEGDKKVEIELLEYIPSATMSLVADPKGVAMFEMMIVSDAGPETIVLSQGESYETADYVIDFGSSKSFNKPVIAVSLDQGALVLNHKQAIETLNMDSKAQGVLNASSKTPFAFRTLHSVGQTRFVLKQFYAKATKKLISKEKEMRKQMGQQLDDALKVRVTFNGESKEAVIFGTASSQGTPKVIDFKDAKVALSYGAKIIVLPFAIKLKDFEMERYPGSNAPSSYASEVFLVDKEMGIEQDYRIYMNHVLDHRGFRFFQSSYDRDELGTVLSVNYDFWGTMVTYIGYILLALGFFGSFFIKKGRFQRLRKELEKVRALRQAMLFAFALALSLSAPSLYAQEAKTEVVPTQAEMHKVIKAINKEHADRFATLLSQGRGGRLEPLDSLNQKILHKLYKGNSFIGLNANQVILGMIVNPQIWQSLPIIKIGDPEIAKLLKLSPNAKYASFVNFYPPELEGQYALGFYVEDARRKPAKEQNRLDKALLKVDEAVHVAYMVLYGGDLFKIIPKAEDKNYMWYNLYEIFASAKQGQAVMSQAQTKEVFELFSAYLNALDQSVVNNDWKTADEMLDEVIAYQKAKGAQIYPSDFKVQLEIIYNHLDIFMILMGVLLSVGMILLILAFASIINPKWNFKTLNKGAWYLTLVLFGIYTLGLVARWIIAGHAPWSNGYEAIVYIGWATLLAGIMVSKNSLMTLSATVLLSGITLLVAMMSNFDPQITNLVPVLKSYWLTIHVSMITASYGFLGLAALLGFIGLILFISLSDKNAERLSLSIKEVNLVAEMAVLIGLVLLTVGNFLGGVWANESWGRYWGWDAKETWALVSILVYAVVSHMRYIPKFFTHFRYSVTIVVSYSVILMTFFGVNFYLSGLHSYAKGDPVPVPTWVYYFAATILLVIIAAFFRKGRFVK